MFRMLVIGRRQFFGAALSAMVVATLGIGAASADEYNKKTVFTFNIPVEVPGKALPAGTYVFRLLDSNSNRNIVQIFDKDEKQVFATILALPDYRLKPADKPVILFDERPSDTPPAVKAWFYPGDQYGQQFVYPHTKAVEIAKRTHQNVLSMRDEMEDQTQTKARSASDPGVQELEHTEVAGVDSSGEPIPIIEVIIVKKPVE